MDGAMGLRSFDASVGVLGVEEEGVHVNSAADCSVSEEEIELNTDDSEENADVLLDEAFSKILAIFSTLSVVVVVVPLLRFGCPDCCR